MTIFGYHAPHERFPPGRLLACLQAAEAAGFQAAMCSDHFQPWNERQGQSGFAWSWLGAALQATDLPIGVVNAPGYRYHPAVIAQAAATLEEMFPGRFWVAFGSGQALNEAMTGARWPAKPERNARLKEAVDVIRALWAGETVTRSGLVRVEEAKLYTRPAVPPKLFGAALTPETARWVGGWADGLLMGSTRRDRMREIIDAFRSGGGEGKPVYVQAGHVYARTEEQGRREAHAQWRTNVLGPALQAELRSPAAFDAAAAYVREEDMDEHIRISPDPARHVDWLMGDADLGVDAVFIHHIGPDQERFIEAFGEKVLRELKAESRAPTASAP